MKISYKWLVELTGLDWSAEEMGERLTLCGTACEYIEPTGQYMDKVIVGEVTALSAIEGADKIKRVTVNLGDEAQEVVCGAPNVAAGQKVPVALEGARLAGGFIIKKAKIRGIESAAMICSERELGLSQDHSGIMVLPDEAVPGQSLLECLDYDDYILTFELTPNRADSMSAVGIARDLAALASTKIKRPAFEIREAAEKAADHVKVIIDDAEACPRYAARVIRNIKIQPSPWWLQKKLLTAGIRPISNVVDVTNLVMLETGHPLHAFDLKRFGSDEVVVRRADAGERFYTLDGKEHELTPEVLLITNGKTGVAAGGVMGGLNSEVEDDTSEILLEAAYFNPKVIRRSRRELGMVSESSMRFEKGADPNGVPYAINRAAYLFQEVCGGEVLQGIVDCYPNEIHPKKITFRPARCNKVLGTEISAKKIESVFVGLEFQVEDGEKLSVTVPTFRPDIEREIDLIEEVARIIGFNEIPDAVENIGPLYTPLHIDDAFRDKVQVVLTGAGFDEMLNHGLADSRTAEFLNPGMPLLKIANPVSEELNVMRNSMIHTALNVVGHNLAHRNLNLRLFEIGKCYFPPNDQGEWLEEERLVLAVSGNTPGGWRDKPRALDFYDLRGAIDRLMQHLSSGPIEFRPQEASYLEDELAFSIDMDGQPVGEAGMISKAVLDKLGLKQPVYMADLALSPLMAASRRRAVFEPLAIYPSAPRDLSIVVDEHVKVGEIIDQVRATAGDLAESVEIFDLYTGKQIAGKKKSIAFTINYRSSERNLSSEEVEQLQQVVVGMLKHNFNAEIRDN